MDSIEQYTGKFMELLAVGIEIDYKGIREYLEEFEQEIRQGQEAKTKAAIKAASGIAVDSDGDIYMDIDANTFDEIKTT